MLKDIVKKARPELAPVAGAAQAPAPPDTDPWYRDDERKAEVNEASPRAGARWLGRRGREWLR